MNMSMDTYCDRFHFAWDMNGDLAFTISDVWLLMKAIFLLPATAVVSLLHHIDSTATFFEIDCQTGTSFGGAAASMFLWLFILGMIGAVLDQLKPPR